MISASDRKSSFDSELFSVSSVEMLSEDAMEESGLSSSPPNIAPIIPRETLIN
jgi:hypothetical protein